MKQNIQEDQPQLTEDVAVADYPSEPQRAGDESVDKVEFQQELGEDQSAVEAAALVNEQSTVEHKEMNVEEFQEVVEEKVQGHQLAMDEPVTNGDDDISEEVFQEAVKEKVQSNQPVDKKVTEVHEEIFQETVKEEIQGDQPVHKKVTELTLMKRSFSRLCGRKFFSISWRRVFGRT